ncbi:MAG: cytochrome-c peroxidase [Betaproteobacteria bacterium]|nr:cytochrome-c peroxidase [Betaproteobacteria bacterium]
MSRSPTGTIRRGAWGRVAAWSAGMTVLVIGGGLAQAPIPWSMWYRRPLEAFWLAQGLNPHPIRLVRPPVRKLTAVARLGQKLFYDPRLSASGRMSCATCHSPAHAFGPPDGAAVARGGPALKTPGVRAVPSLRYLYRQPIFSIGPDFAAGENDRGPTLSQQAQQATRHIRVRKTARSPRAAAANWVPEGGLFWDGRADTLQQQASGPLFNPAEMDAGTPARVALLLEHSGYAEDFRRLFGAGIFGDPRQVVAEATFALARYQIESSAFHPFTSKFDAWLAGKARFDRAELQGYLAFNDPDKGNCAACHLDRPTRDGLPPLFTDFQYEALGVPRNPDIPANRDPHYYDLGLCGPFRTDLRNQAAYCGMFVTPSLRNVATRYVFFHNGVFHSLTQVLEWYVNRDLHPSRFYPKDAAGRVVKYDDMPARYRINVDTTDAPFHRHPGDPPALTRAQIRDVIAFLKTLTDGYRPGDADRRRAMPR